MKTAKILLFKMLIVILFTSSIYSQDNYNESQIRHHYELYNDARNYKVIRNSDFLDLKKVINDRWFESTKLDFAKNAISDNYFTTDQIEELLELFSFESSKLELAKLAYPKTVNNRKYYKLFDVFWFESSITELNEYIRNYK